MAGKRDLEDGVEPSGREKKTLEKEKAQKYGEDLPEIRMWVATSRGFAKITELGLEGG